MYEVYIEKAAENDLKHLPITTFHRIIPILEHSLGTQDLRVAEKLLVRRTTGESELETIVSFMKLMRKRRP